MMENGNPSLIWLNGLRSEKFATKLIPEAIARQHMILPLWLEDGELLVACPDPSDQAALREVEIASRRRVRAFRAGYSDLRAALDSAYGIQANGVETPDLGQALFQLGHISSETLTRLRALQVNSGKSLLQSWREQNLVKDEDLAEAVGFDCFLPHIRLGELDISVDLSPLLSWEMATRRKVIPLLWLANTLVVATPDLPPGDRLEDISRLLGVAVQPWLCSYPDWDYLYRRLYLRGAPNTRQQDLEIAQSLAKRGVLADTDLQGAQAVALQTERELDDVIIANGIVSRSEWMSAQSKIYKMLLAPDLDAFAKDSAHAQELACLLPEVIAKRFLILPIQQEDSRLMAAIAKPDPGIVHLIEGLTGLQLIPYLLAPEEIKRRVEILYQHAPSQVVRSIPGLGSLLLTLGIITEDQFQETESWDMDSDQALGKELIQRGYLDEEGLVEALGIQTGLPHLRLDHVRFEHKYYSEIPVTLARDHVMLPVWSNERDLWIAIADPWDFQGLNKVEKVTGKRVWPILSPRSKLLAALERFVGGRGTTTIDLGALRLLEKLVGSGYLTQLGATEVRRAFTREDLPFDQLVARASTYAPEEIARAVAEMNGLPFVDLQLTGEIVTRIDPLGQRLEKKIANDPVDEQAATLLRLEDAKRFSALPIRFSGSDVVVAFANPLYTQDRNEIEKKLSRKIIPVFAYREDLHDAIERVLGKRNIGTFLLLDGSISRSQLNDALALARNTGVRLGRALVNKGYVTENQLYRYLAKQTSLPLLGLQELNIDKKIAVRITPEAARENGILPIRDIGGRILLATVDPLNSQALEMAKETLGADIQPALVTERDFDQALESLFSREYLARSISELLERTPEDSAFRVLSMGQIICLILFLLGSAAWILFDFTSYMIVLNSIATLFYIAFSGYKFYLVYRALSHTMEISVNPEDLDALDDRNLPIYTLLVPVYKEAEVLPELLGALTKLDYPATKLDIQVLMEEDDLDTIEAFNRCNPPSHFHGIVVPYGEPKTKPKACNYGLIHARGDYVVIFDAEDIPEPDQLKKILVGFSKAPPNVACIQCKLNYYNSGQNLLTQWFTVEYSMWFDLFLPGLSASRAPIPLGGTSNHFKKDVLVEIGAWDPYNVTEDADLGMRLFKRGYQTAIVDSTTFEEANSQLYGWIRQRSRWIKGYIQTWLVSMRDPVRLIREIGIKAFFSFQFVIGGTFFAALLNPVYWLLTTIWFLVQWKFIQVVFPSVIYFLGAFALFIGNFAFTYMNVAGALRRQQYGMVKYALMSPVYWGLASVAAWMGFIQLFYKPHFWEKTVHGLHKEETTRGSANVDSAKTP